VLKIEYNPQDETWKAATFATVTPSFRSNSLPTMIQNMMEKKLLRDEAERVSRKLLEDLREMQDIEHRRLMSEVPKLQEQLVSIKELM